MKPNIKKLCLSAMFLAMGYLLPFLTGKIPEIGRMLLPMHIPVLLCGFICGGGWGFAVGLIVPFLCAASGMPPILTAAAMSPELAIYGLTCGLMYKLLPKKNIYIYIDLIIAMIAGRIVNGAASLLIYGITKTEYTFGMFLTGTVTGAIPGIIIQLILIPAIIILINKYRNISEKHQNYN